MKNRGVQRHNVTTEVFNCSKHDGLWAWPEPKHNRNGMMLNCSGTVRVSVIIRGGLLVCVGNLGNFGTTNMYYFSLLNKG